MSDTSQNLSSLLEQLQSHHGLQLVAVAGMDGMLVDSASDGNVDAEIIAAVAAPGLLMMGELARELDEDTAQMTTMEYQNRVVVLMPLNDDTLLVVVAEPGGMNLGQLRIVLRRAADAFRAAVEQI